MTTENHEWIVYGPRKIGLPCGQSGLDLNIKSEWPWSKCNFQTTHLQIQIELKETGATFFDRNGNLKDHAFCVGPNAPTSKHAILSGADCPPVFIKHSNNRITFEPQMFFDGPNQTKYYRISWWNGSSEVVFDPKVKNGPHTFDPGFVKTVDHIIIGLAAAFALVMLLVGIWGWRLIKRRCSRH